MIRLKFTEIALEPFLFLEAREAELNSRGKLLLQWLRRRYPSREVVRLDDATVVTKITYWPPPSKAPSSPPP